MSGFERVLQSFLQHANPRWAREFEGLVREEEVRAALHTVQRLGGDPNFVLFVLAHFRWRRITPLPALRERNRVVRALRLLLEGQGEWCTRLRGLAGDEWKEAERILRSALTFLESYHPTDESAFEVRGTRHESGTPRALSDHAATCLLALDWHVRQATGSRRTNRMLLGTVMDAFGLIRRSSGESSADAARWVEKRLEREAKKDEHGHSRREFVEKFVVSPLVPFYHDVHTSRGFGCGSACRPFERGIRAADQQRLLYAVGKASVLLRAGAHAEARYRFPELLKQAEGLLGPEHVALVPILEGYAAALRAVGERQAAAMMGKRMAGILRAARRRSRDLIGFQPGAGPKGELLPIWREEVEDAPARHEHGSK